MLVEQLYASIVSSFILILYLQPDQGRKKKKTPWTNILLQHHDKDDPSLYFLFYSKPNKDVKIPGE